MIRLFAPHTRDPFLRPDAVTVTNLVIHIAACIALLVPLGKVAKEELLDRLIVYLVPPDTPGSHDRGKGATPYNAEAPDAGFQHGAREAHPVSEATPALGKAPTIDAANVEAAIGPLPGDNALTVLEVDSSVVRDPLSAAPEYPPHLVDRGIEGSAAVRFVVDTEGVVDTITYRVIRATHPDFAVAVRRVLRGMRFRPAIRAGSKVRQLVEQTFSFRIAPRESLPPVPRPAPPA
jgi:TonB family protein